MSAAPTYEFPGGCEVPLPVSYTLGLDLGKLSDYSALAIAQERPQRVVENFGQATIAPVWADDPFLSLLWLERWPKLTSYHRVAEAVAALVTQLIARDCDEVRLFVDATGVGSAVVEILLGQPVLRGLTSRWNGEFVAVTITAGERVKRGIATSDLHNATFTTLHTPKAELIGVAQMALEGQRLEVASQLPEAATLVDELRTFQVKITESANATFNAASGAHDDLVIAAALAAWGSRQRPPGMTVGNYRTGVTTTYGRNGAHTYQATRRGDVPPYGNGVGPYGRLRIG